MFVMITGVVYMLAIHFVCLSACVLPVRQSVWHLSGIQQYSSITKHNNTTNNKPPKSLVSRKFVPDSWTRETKATLSNLVCVLNKTCTFILVYSQHPGQTLAIPPWVGTMSTGQRAVMLCGWGVKTSMARVWWQVKLCEHLYNTCHV